MKIPYVNLGRQIEPLMDEVMDSVREVLMSGMYVLGQDVSKFETNIAKYCGAKYAIGVSNGTDALILALKALGIGEGDEVITAPNSFLASTSAIALVGAKPVFVDVCNDYNINPLEIEKAITDKTRAILPIHLTGNPAKINNIVDIAKKHNLYVIEDCAQAIGASVDSKKVGTFGDLGCFSLHPLKNLNACGDGGLITTNSDKIYEWILKARNHGLKNRDECEFWGYNFRLDTIQAAILNIKLLHLDDWNDRRIKLAKYYASRLENYVTTPIDLICNSENCCQDNQTPSVRAVYHTFIIQAKKRDELQAFLSKKGIDSKVHYPISIHLQEAAKSLGYSESDFPVTSSLSKTILSLPVYPELTDKEVEYVCDSIQSFYEQ